jgi:hypothetical protein
MSGSRPFSYHRLAKFLVPSLIAIGIIVLNEIGNNFFGWQKVREPLLFLPVVVGFVIAIIYLLIRRRFKVALSCVVGIAVCYIFLFQSPFSDYIIRSVLYAKVHMYAGRYRACAASALDVGDGKKLSVCEKNVIDNGLMYSDLPYVTAIIYDSGDQLLLPTAKRSSEWQQAAYKLGLRQELNSSSLGYKPEMKDVFGEPESLGGHYYYVTL